MLTFDTDDAQLILTQVFGNLKIANYESQSFQWTYGLFGENQFSTTYSLQVVDQGNGTRELYLYSPVPETPINLNFIITLGGTGIDIPTSGLENQLANVAFVNRNATGFFDYFVGISPATYSVTYANAVPEPATWAMMIGGVGMVGGALRRRHTSRPFAAAA